MATIRFDELRAVRDLLRWSHFGHPAAEVDDVEALLVAIPAFSPQDLESNLLRSLATQDPDLRGGRFQMALQRLPSVAQSLSRINATLRGTRAPIRAAPTRAEDRDVGKDRLRTRILEREEMSDGSSEPRTRGPKDWSSLDASLRELAQPIKGLGLTVDQALLVASLPWVTRAASGARLLTEVRQWFGRASSRFGDRFERRRMCGRIQWDRDGLSLLGRFVWPIEPPDQIPSGQTVSAESPNRDILLVDLGEGGFAHAWVNLAAGVATVRARFRAPPADKEKANQQVASRFATMMKGTYAGMTPA